MRKCLLAVVIVLLSSAALARGQQAEMYNLLTAARPEAPASQPAQASPAKIAPATEPAAAAVAPSDTLSDTLAKTTVGQLFRGKRTLSPQEAMQLQFWLDAGRDLGITAICFVPRLFVAGLFLVVFWIIYRAVRRIVLGGMSHANVDQSIRDMLGHLIKWSIMGFGVVIACNQIGIQITALLTGVSIIGLAIGFAAQETLANFIAGVVIFWDKPFKATDWIEIEGVFAQVLRITFRSTRLLNQDGETIILPNTKMLSNKVVNHTTNPINRVNVAINIPHRGSIDEARGALLALTTEDKRVMNDPPPAVVVNDCTNDSVNLVLRFWIKDESHERAMRCEYLEKAKKALDAADLAFVPASLPMPAATSPEDVQLKAAS